MGNREKDRKQALKGVDRKERELHRLMKRKGIVEHFTPESYILP